MKDIYILSDVLRDLHVLGPGTDQVQIISRRILDTN